MERATPWNGNEFMFVHESHRDSEDVELFLGPFADGERETIVWFTHADWSDIAVAVGIFPSKSQARKNGWGEPLEKGLSDRQQKKGKFVKRDIWVLNEFDMAHSTG